MDLSTVERLFRFAPVVTVAGIAGAVVVIVSAIKNVLDTGKSFVELQKARIDLKRLRAGQHLTETGLVVLTNAEQRSEMSGRPRFRRALPILGLVGGIIVLMGANWWIARRSAYRLIEVERVNATLDRIISEARLYKELADREVTSEK